MPTAAVPSYLGRDFKDASPGLRFGLLLPIWTTRQDQEAEVRQRAEAKSREGQEVADLLRQGMEVAIEQLRRRRNRPLPGLWDKNDFAARWAWTHVKALTKQDQALMASLGKRQSGLSQTVAPDGLLRLEALATAPFTTGLGNEHPLENGFAFLNPYGLPYLPGSGVKGVLRQAARELASGDWGDPQGWTQEPRYPLRVNGKPALDSRKQPIVLTMLDVLFGRDTPGGESDHVRGALSFWDVVPQIAGDSLQVEIMTPHQSHYYQERAHAGSITPHESGQPNPISFLTVPPGSAFTFHVICDRPFLARLAPDLAEDGAWKTLLAAAFTHAFDWLGFGAKTAVGYGAMRRDLEREAEALRQQETRVREAQAEADAQRQAEAKQAALAAMDPVERSIQELLDTRPDKSQPEISAVIGAVKQGRWEGQERVAVARWLKNKMQATKGSWKESSQAKKPEKDRDYQNTLLVKQWLGGD